MPLPASSTPRRAAEPLAKFPEPVRLAYAQFEQTGDADALDAVVLAVVRDFMPETVALKHAPELPDDARLIADLSFDSLAISETVFFLEDIFHVRIAHAEIMQIATIGELRRFVRRKLARPKAS